MAMWLALAIPAAEARHVRVATYNILDGTGAIGSAAYNALQNVLARMDADIVCFQELQTTTFAAWSNLAAVLGYPYAAISGNGPYSGSLYNGYFSRFPILSTYNVGSPPGAVELSRFPFRAVIDVPEAQHPLVLWTMHHKSSDASIDKFRRSIEAYRIVQDVNAYLAEHPDHVEYVLTGDMNDDIRDSQTPVQFASQPSGAPGGFVLGADIVFPVAYALFPVDRYASAGFLRMPAFWEGTTTPITRVASSRQLDYIFLSPALMNSPLGVPQGEIYYSDMDAGGGLPKLGDPLPAGASATASDHLPIFVDIQMADYSSVLPTAGFVSIGEAGGPFDPESKTYTLTNTNAFNTSWTAESDVDWLSFSKESFDLSPFSPKEVVVSLNENADALTPGVYQGTFTFRDTTTDLLETRDVTLTIRDSLGVGPAEGLASGGLVGGPFNPASKTYVVTNKSDLVIAFNATASANWVTVSPSLWLLQPGQSVEVQVTLNANALGLPIGTYVDTVVFSNEVTGLVQERPVSLSIAGALCDAVDRCDLAWTTGGQTNWLFQTNVTVDGTDAAQSGTIVTNQQTWMETTISGPGQIGFDWRVSSRTNAHFLRFLDNDASRDQISGEMDWSRRSYELASGIHTLRWTYATTTNAPQGSNAGWVDQVVLDHLAATPSNAWAASGLPGGPFSPATRAYVLTNSGSAPLQWAALPGVAWISAAPASGELEPGGSATVECSLNAAANLLPLGTHAGSITFSNQTTGCVLERYVVLATTGALCDAVDRCDLAWTTGGTSNWFNETNTTFDSVDAAQSGRISTNQQTWLETTVTGPATLAFRWKVSSRSTHYLRFLINGASQATIGGTIDWTRRIYVLPSGTQTLRWVFTNTTTAAQGTNAGWVDDVVVDYFNATPSNNWHSSGMPGGPFSPTSRPYVLSNPGPDPLPWTATPSVDWISAEPAAGELEPGESTTVECSLNGNAALLPSGTYLGGITFSNQTTGFVLERQASLSTLGSLCEALDQCDLNWDTGSSAPWFYQSTNTFDGIDAAQSGRISTNQQSWLETIVQGPLQIRFQWRASSRTNSHYLRFFDNGSAQSLISGETGWLRQSYEVPPGLHTLRWTFTNNTAAAVGSNTAWVDQVTLDYFSALPADVWYASGLPGGPFTPATRQYVLTNSNPDLLTWTATSSVPWITVDPSSGELEPGDTMTIDMGINTNANSLSLGTFSGTVTFSNQATGFTFLRQVSLSIQDHLIITPSSSASHTGFVGGPYTPATRTFVLSNSSPEAVSWSVLVLTNGWPTTTRTNWVTPEPTNGTIEPGTTQNVLFSFNENTDGLSATMHYARISFYDATTGLTQERYLFLTLQAPLSISSSGWAASGPIGGPFAPTSNIYTLTNPSPVSQTWTVAASASWLSLDTAGGTLATNSATQITASLNAQAAALPKGFYSASIILSNLTSGGSATTQAVSLAVGIDFCDAIEACQLNWSHGGNAPWLYQTNYSKDAIDAAASGAILDNQESWMQTSVTGPGTLAFWWKVSSEGSYDYLEFSIDGILTNRISGTVDWQQQAYTLATGVHALRWRYMKDGSASSGSDRGWVDLVSWTLSRTAMGVPVEWYQRFGLAPAEGGAWDDLDPLPSAAGDPNWFQYVAGLDPTDSNDWFRIWAVRQESGQPTQIQWWGGTNGPSNPYVIQSTLDAEHGPWEGIGSSPRAAGLNAWTNAEPADRMRFYRILAAPDPAP